VRASASKNITEKLADGDMSKVANKPVPSPDQLPSSLEQQELEAGAEAARGIPIQCHFCHGQAFRRSRLRGADFWDILLMRYPVRCLRCNQRQMVSFTIAGISVPSHVKQRRARLDYKGPWTEPVKESLKPKSARLTDESKAGVEQQEKQTS
jgi:hypothetical protein